MNFEPLSDTLIAKHERAQRQATLDGVAALLRAKGASEHSLQTVLTGFDEYLTITSALPPPSSPYTPPPAPARPNDSPADLVTHDCTLPLSQIPIQPLTWLWPQRIPLGKLTLLDGEPGCGTSLLALTLAACISRGLPLPGDTTPSTTQGNVLLIAPHDHASDTIKPRLQAAGADPSHIFLLTRVPTGAATPTATTPERPFCLADDLDLLEATITRLHTTLVIIDPLHAVLEPARSHSSSPSSPASRRQTPRSLLASLARLAQRTGCAFLLVRSVIPKRSDLLHARPTGSPELLSAVPSGLLLTSDPGDVDTHLLLATKHTLCQKPAILAYEIIEHPSGVPVIHWRGTWQGSLAFVLGMGPALSAQRQAILAFLHQSPAPASAGDISSRTGFDYEPVRKMLQRMAQQADLVSPARGLYTIPNHPCLTNTLTDPETSPPQNPVPNVATQTIPPHIGVSIVATETTPPQTNVPSVATNTPSPQTNVPSVAYVPNPQYHPLPAAPVSISPSTTPDQTENAPP